MVAVMLPAGGGGGGAVSRLSKCATTGDGSARPAGFLKPVVTVMVYAVFAVNSAEGRNVALVLPADRLSAPDTTPPPGAVTTMAPAPAPVVLAGSIGSENVATMALDSATLEAPSAGVSAVIVGTCVNRRRSSGTSAPAAGTVVCAAPVSRVARSRAAIDTAPSFAIAM
jgi:hypothetical protein